MLIAIIHQALNFVLLYKYQVHQINHKVTGDTRCVVTFNWKNEDLMKDGLIIIIWSLLLLLFEFYMIWGTV
jgi:hypothetical protein